MKIEYGQVGQRKPRYDRMASKITLHVGGISEEAEEKMIALKFGVFGSIGEVKFLRNKNIGKRQPRQNDLCNFKYCSIC